MAGWRIYPRVYRTAKLCEFPLDVHVFPTIPLLARKMNPQPQSSSYPPQIPYIAWAIAVTVIVYACWNTGLATDDFVLLNRALTISVADDLLPATHISVPLMHYAIALPFHLIGDAFWGYGLMKAVYLCFAAFSAFRFFSLFASESRAFLGMLVFVLSPIHDGATLWFMGQYLLISLSCYLLAYYMAATGKPISAFLFALAGSFASYGSAPLAVFLVGLFLYRKDYRNATILFIPNLIYTAYYCFTSVYLKIGIERIPTSLDLTRLAKSYTMQVLSFVDAALGPSAWLKTGLSLASMSVLSIILAVVILTALWRTTRVVDSDQRPPRDMLVAVFVMTLCAFGLFALTGKYPQIAFNEGNRVTLFGNLLIAVLAMRWLPEKLLKGVGIVACAAFIGLGDHWSQWNTTVQKSIKNIRSHPELTHLSDRDMLFVSGLQYSQLGDFAHIEYFTADYTIREIFAFATHRISEPRTISLNRRMRFYNHHLVDIKYGNAYPVKDSILIYDATNNRLNRVKAHEIQLVLDNLPEDNRHWIQLVGQGKIRKTILWLMPGVSYAFK
jgi:hypothetical protein